jgi:antitoxin ParD1/3/4
MNVTLPPELEQYIARKVESGQYLCESEVILEGLHLLRQRDELDKIRLEELRKEIAIGIEQADRGELVDGKAVFERLRQGIQENSCQHS